MKIISFYMCLIALLFCKNTSAQMDTIITKAKVNNFSIKVSHVSSALSSRFGYNYLHHLSGKSFGTELTYRIPLFNSKNSELEIGVGYFYRNIIKSENNMFDNGDVVTMVSTDLKLIHQTIEIPIAYNFKFYNYYKHNVRLNIGFANVYLAKGNLSLNSPSNISQMPYQYNPSRTFVYTEKYSRNSDGYNGIPIEKFLPRFNFKTILGLTYSYNKLGVGLGYNYFLNQIGKGYAGENEGRKTYYNALNTSLTFNF